MSVVSGATGCSHRHSFIKQKDRVKSLLTLQPTPKQHLSHRQIKRKRRKLNKQNEQKQKKKTPLSSSSSNVIPLCHADLDPEQLSSHNDQIFDECLNIATKQYTNYSIPIPMPIKNKNKIKQNTKYMLSIRMKLLIPKQYEVFETEFQQFAKIKNLTNYRLLVQAKNDKFYVKNTYSTSNPTLAFIMHVFLFHVN